MEAVSHYHVLENLCQIMKTLSNTKDIYGEDGIKKIYLNALLDVYMLKC